MSFKVRLILKHIRIDNYLLQYNYFLSWLSGLIVYVDETAKRIDLTIPFSALTAYESTKIPGGEPDTFDRISVKMGTATKMHLAAQNQFLVLSNFDSEDLSA